VKPEDANEGGPSDVTTSSDDLDKPGLALPIPKKEKKTAEELAAMIHDDLSMIEGCPRRGVNVTVYGLNPWNSMLMFGVEAGPVRNKVELQGLYEVITERLKRLYDVGP
jgi:hypothetical protein